MQEPVRVYTPATLAERWHCSGRHIRNLINRGELKAFRLGGKLLRISAEEVEDYERRNGSP
jgi:excisionase family DNA binding protein